MVTSRWEKGGKPLVFHPTFYSANADHVQSSAELTSLTLPNKTFLTDQLGQVPFVYH